MDRENEGEHAMRTRTFLMLVVTLALIATACAGDVTEAETTASTAAAGDTTTTTAVQESTTITSVAPAGPRFF